MTTKRFTVEQRWEPGQQLARSGDRLVALPCLATELDEGHIHRLVRMGYDRGGRIHRREPVWELRGPGSLGR